MSLFTSLPPLAGQKAIINPIRPSTVFDKGLNLHLIGFASTRSVQMLINNMSQENWSRLAQRIASE